LSLKAATTPRLANPVEIKRMVRKRGSKLLEKKREYFFLI
jgi:hypothetical protein